MILIDKKTPKNISIGNIQATKCIFTLIKLRLPNSQKDNYLKVMDLTDKMFVGFCNIENY